MLSQVAVVRVANVVDPLYTVVAKFPKRHLPPPADDFAADRGPERAARISAAPSSASSGSR